MNLEIDCLRTFAHVANTMSFSRAGEAVRRARVLVSPPMRVVDPGFGLPPLPLWKWPTCMSARTSRAP